MKQRSPKETKPEPPYLAVWFEVNKIGDSVNKKTSYDPKVYTKEPKVYYFPSGYAPQEAVDEIYQEYGERDQQCLTRAHSFSHIHGYMRVDAGRVITEQKTFPIK